MNTKLSSLIAFVFLMFYCSNKHSIQYVKDLTYDELLQNEGKWLSQDKTEELILEYEKLASNGDLNAMARLGHLYNPIYALLGGRMPQGYQKGISLNWYKQAAIRGHIEAIEKVGRYYEEGIDVEQNFFEAYRWYTKGYEKAPKVFALKMHHLYNDGIGAEKNLKKAAAFFQEAKRSAEKDSQLASTLGQSYLNGYNGLPKDTSAAKYWLEKALKLGDIFAELELQLVELKSIKDPKKLDSIALIVKERHKKTPKKIDN